MFRILKPVYQRTGESTMTPEGPIHWHRVDFVEVGTAESMQDALKKLPRSYWSGCYSPVLEEIGSIH